MFMVVVCVPPWYPSPGHESDDDRNQIMKSNEFHVKRWMFVLPLFY